LKAGKRKVRGDILLLVGTLLLLMVLLSLFPARRWVVMVSSWNFFLKMILILPAVMILMGLFSIFVERETVVKYLGRGAGMKGVFLALLFGALPTGPLYIAFPIAASLLRKGARISAIIAFLSAWACIKVPQEIVELQFLGPHFMALRLALTVIFAVLMGLTIERILDQRRL